MKKISSLFLGSFALFVAFGFTNQANAQTPTERIDSIRRKMESAEDTLKDLKDHGNVTFKTTDDEQDFVVAQRKIKTSIEELTKLNEQVSGLSTEQQNEIRYGIEEAKFLKDTMMSYLIPNNIFGYKIVREAVAIDFEIQAGMEEVFKRVTKHIGIGGIVGGKFQLNSNSHEQRVAHFTKLKSAYYNALLGVAAIDPSNIQLKALANWGSDTKVATGGDDMFGKELITSDEMDSLNLK